jgi:hypothetical protein
MRTRGAFAAFLVACVINISCGGVVDPSQNKIDTFTATVQVQGSSVNPFATSNSGEFSVKVTTITPTTGGFFGVILAQGPTDNSCAGNLPILQQNSFATAGTIAMSGAIIPGNYCVYVYDIGAFTVPQTYTIQISHP